jgi:hypothetical protein
MEPKSKTLRPLPVKHVTSEEDKWTVLMLVLLRLTDLVEKWKRSRSATRPMSPRVKTAGKAAEKALNDFVRVVLSEEKAAKKKRR